MCGSDCDEGGACVSPGMLPRALTSRRPYLRLPARPPACLPMPHAGRVGCVTALLATRLPLAPPPMPTTQVGGLGANTAQRLLGSPLVRSACLHHHSACRNGSAGAARD